MGSMEQIFTIFNDDKIEAWGPMCGVQRIDGLSEISLDKIQSIWNKIHSKYQSLQCQFLTNNNVREYDDIYIGCLPFKVEKYGGNIDKLFKSEINHRFLLLNDFGLKTKQDISNNQYNIRDIAPLYRIFVCNDCFLMNFNHALIDGMSCIVLINDVLRLLNGDKFNTKPLPYLSIEQCIKPEYASSAIERKISNLIPTKWAIKFGKFYANNSFLSKYNPLFLHRDDILRFQFYFNENILTFPLKSFNKKDYRINVKYFRLSKSISQGVKRQCKLNNVHMSSLFQYLITESMIECHNHILKKDKYTTMVNNVFTTIPMYKDPKKVYLGVHASAYNTLIYYDKNIKINTDKFWKNVQRIDAQVLNDDMVAKVYKNKFPFMNLKKFMKDILEDKTDIFNGKSFGAPTVSNPGAMNLNKPHWKYKIIESYGAANPGIGMGAPYMLGGTTIKGIDIMRIAFVYGVQHLSEDMAQNVMNKLQNKLEIIGSSNTTIQSKL